MTDALVKKLIELYRLQLREIEINTPVNLNQVEISSFQIEQESGNNHKYLVINFQEGVAINHIAKGSLKAPPNNSTIIVQPWFWFSLYMAELLGSYKFEFLEYVVDSGAILSNPENLPDGSPSQRVETGDELATNVSTLKLGFFKRNPNGNPEYISPSVILRLLGYLSHDMLNFLDKIVRLDNNGNHSFFLNKYFEFHNNIDSEPGRKWLSEQVLRNEYHHLDLIDASDDQFSFPQNTRDEYHSKLNALTKVNSFDHQIKYSDLLTLISNSNFENLFPATNPLRYWEIIEDKSLFLLVLKADGFELDLVNLKLEGIDGTPPIGGGFSNLWLDETKRHKQFTENKFVAFINSTIFDTKSKKPDYKPIGSVKFKNSAIYTGHPEDNMPELNQIHIFQEANDNVVFGNGRLPANGINPNSGQPFTVGIDNLRPYIVSGVTQNQPPGDFVRNKVVGATFFGEMIKNGTKYFFVLCRPDFTSGRLLKRATGAITLEMLEKPASYEEIINLLESLGATYALYPDGGTSSGLIILDRGIVVRPAFVPSSFTTSTKDKDMPFAIGFRRK